jgi:hypothetical protein
MSSKDSGAAIYLVGHGSLSQPRLIELQHQRVLRYRTALAGKYESSRSAPQVFVDLELPRFAMGKIDLGEVPEFSRLREGIQNKQFSVVYIDLEENPGFTPRYESEFVRSELEDAGAKVLNAFYDDEKAFEQALKARYGEYARSHEITESSDFVCFFPFLASEIAASVLRRELQDGGLPQIGRRLEELKKSKSYAAGRIPFVEERLTLEWKRGEQKLRDGK